MVVVFSSTVCSSGSSRGRSSSGSSRYCSRGSSDLVTVGHNVIFWLCWSWYSITKVLLLIEFRKLRPKRLLQPIITLLLCFLSPRMDSYVLAETFKYLYLMFTEKDDLLMNIDNYIFTTEAHLLPLSLSVQNYTLRADTVRILCQGWNILPVHIQ